MLQKQLDLLDIDISNIMDELNSPISSIPGIGTWLGAIIISEIGDISRFSSATKLLAFAGLDPSVGNQVTLMLLTLKFLKEVLNIYAMQFIMQLKLLFGMMIPFYQYYTTKLAQGKSYLNAIGHVAHKLTRVIFKLLTTNTTFKG